MASSGNFCTMNPLSPTSNTMVYSFGNLRASPGSNWSETTWCKGNTVIPSDKKIYFECLLQARNIQYNVVGIATNLAVPTATTAGGTGSVTIHNSGKYVNGTYTSGIFALSDAPEGAILQVAVDGATRKVWLGINNTWIGSGDPANGSNEAGTVTVSNSVGYDLLPVSQNNSLGAVHFNFGQDSTFGAEKTAGGNSDGNGFGDFAYAPPTGFLALCSGNLSVSDDIDPAQTDDDYPGKQFNAITYTGNGSTNAITGLGFQPDFVWIKKTSSGSNQDSRMFDSNRGVTKVLSSVNTDAESTDTGTLTAFDSDGFTVSSNANVNGSSSNYVAWCWRANGGTTSSNSDGTITTTLQVGKGFSIGTYTGTGSNATVGHGLGAVPDFTIFRERSSSGNWVVTSQKNMSSNDHNLYLQLDNAQSDGNYFQNTAMTSSVISIGTHADINGSSNTYVMYNWINVEGYQKFGTYVGSGGGNSATDNTFVYTGFRPRFLFVKNTGAASSWIVYDTARNTSNPTTIGSTWNESGAEFDTSNYAIDILSNGFKFRTGNATVNTTDTWIYGAWGDVPFKYNNAF